MLGTTVPVQKGITPGSLVFLPLFCIFVSYLYSHIDKGTIVSYVNNFSIMVSGSTDIFTHASAIDLSFGILKTELMNWRILEQRGSENTLLISIRGNTFAPKDKIRWLDYWFTSDLQSIFHYKISLQKAKAIYRIV